MKILMVTGTFPPRNFGGITNVSYNLAKLLAQQGHDVTVYTTDTGNNEWSRLKTRPIEFRERMTIRYFKNISNLLAFRYRLYLPINMISTIKKNIADFEIIHLHDFRCFCNIIIHHYAKKYNIPYVLEAHGSVLPISKKKRLKKLFDLIFGYKLLKDASKVIALTKTEVEQYKIMGVEENKIEILPNGINIYEYSNLPKKGKFRKKFNIKNNEKIILYLGRIDKTKGIDLLVKAYAEISKEIDNIRLVLVGPDDGYQSTLEELIRSLDMENKILFTGFVNSEEKTAAFVDADVFVTPSFSGFPVTFLEACICGTPIITTTKGDKLDWIHDKVGYVVEYDKDHLKDAILKVLTYEKLGKKFGENGRRLVKEEFSWNKIVKKLEKIYENVIYSYKLERDAG